MQEGVALRRRGMVEDKTAVVERMVLVAGSKDLVASCLPRPCSGWTQRGTEKDLVGVERKCQERSQEHFLAGINADSTADNFAGTSA